MTRRLRIFIVSTIVALALYCGVFSFWWFRSPSRQATWRGKNVRIVEFHFNSLSWRTRPFWTPAFWFVEDVCGYEQSGFIALYEQSVQIYLK